MLRSIDGTRTRRKGKVLRQQSPRITRLGELMCEIIRLEYAMKGQRPPSMVGYKAT